MGEGRSLRFVGLLVAVVLSLAVIMAVLSLGSFRAVSNVRPYLEKDTGNKLIKLSETPATDVKDNTQKDATYFFLKAMAVVFSGLVVFYLIRASIIAQRRVLHGAKGNAGGAPDDRNNVSFVVDTFHSMVSTLKEKEKELKELKEQAEERARSVEAYNENILKSIQSGVMTFDRQGVVVTSNAASEGILEMAEGTCKGKSYSEVFGTGSWLARLIEKTISDGRPEKRGEGELNLGGGQKWLGAGTSLLKSDDGEISGVILVFTDITEVKGLRERMEMKERIAVLGEMSAGIAHELRNPMGVISGYAEYLARSLNSDPSALDAVNSMRAEIKGMDEIIREFMSFSQPTNLTITEVDVNALLDESLKALSGTGETIKREFARDDNIPVIEGDAVLLRQAFINIIKNSIESISGEGVVSVKTSLYNSGVSPAAGISLPRGDYIKAEVTDTGTGMDEKQFSKIFMPFFTTKAKGTGLGLALVQKIIVYHGGRIMVRSAPGKGATFTVYLPVRPLERNM